MYVSIKHNYAQKLVFLKRLIFIIIVTQTETLIYLIFLKGKQIELAVLLCICCTASKLHCNQENYSHFDWQQFLHSNCNKYNYHLYKICTFEMKKIQWVFYDGSAYATDSWILTMNILWEHQYSQELNDKKIHFWKCHTCCLRKCSLRCCKIDYSQRPR